MKSLITIAFAGALSLVPFNSSANPFGGPDSIHLGGNVYAERAQVRTFQSGRFTVKVKPRLNAEQARKAVEEMKARQARASAKIEAAKKSPLISGPGMDAVIADGRRQIGSRPSVATLRKWGQEIGTAWPLQTNTLYCAAGLNRALKQAGLPVSGPNPHHVSSFRNWGVASPVQSGAIVVISGRGLREAHVGIVTKVDGHRARLLSWNGSGGRVTEEVIPIQAVAFARSANPKWAKTEIPASTEASLGGH